MKVLDLGRLSYRDALHVQETILQARLNGGEDTIIFVEHEPVLTLGANFHPENLLRSVADYEVKGIAVEPTGRGGDVTYHGPGQLVVYPIFHLDAVERDLHRWLRALEETMIETVACFGLKGFRFPPHTGCWVETESQPKPTPIQQKIAAIGIKVRRWVSMHGIALNCDNDLAPFAEIVPCGIAGYGVTSLSRELGRQVTIEDAKPRVVAAFQSVFSEKIHASA